MKKTLIALRLSGSARDIERTIRTGPGADRGLVADDIAEFFASNKKTYDRRKLREALGLAPACYKLTILPSNEIRKERAFVMGAHEVGKHIARFGPSTKVEPYMPTLFLRDNCLSSMLGTASPNIVYRLVSDAVRKCRIHFGDIDELIHFIPYFSTYRMPDVAAVGSMVHVSGTLQIPVLRRSKSGRKVILTTAGLSTVLKSDCKLLFVQCPRRTN